MNAVPSEWFTLPIPIGTMRKQITGMDYFKEKNQRIQILVQRNDAAVGQTIEGPSSATLTHSWKQYVRRTVTYLSLWNGSMSENMVEAACARDDRYWFNRFTELYDQMSLNVIGGMISPTAAFDLCYPLQEKYESYQPEVLEMNRTTKGFKPGFMGELAVKNVQTGVLEVKGLGEMKSAPILLITDFGYYTRSNAGKRTDFDLGLMNHGWSSLTWKSSIPDLSDPNNPTDPMALPTNILRCASEAKDERPRTVHVWLSLAHLIVKDVDAKLGELQYKTRLVSNDFIELLAGTIVKVQKLLNAPVVVRICPDALFHDASGSFSKLAGELKDALTESGLLATVSDKFWRSMFLAAPGSPYAKKGGLSYIHSVAEKFLMRERLLITCFLNSGIVDKINKEHEMVYEKTLVDPQNYYEFLRDEKVQRRSSQEASQEDEASKRRRRQKTHESKMPWMGEMFGVLEPEPNYEQGSMWIKIDDDIADDTVYRCDTCETANPTTFAEHTANKDTCFNCCANECRLISLAESRNDVFRTAARMLYHFGMSKCPGTPDSEVANMNPHHDLMSFIVEMARTFAKCPSFQKEVSCFGGVRVSASLTKAFFRSGRVKSIFVVKEREGNATYYRGSVDLGNVTYSRYMSTILSKEIFEELFGTEPKPTEERVADMVEAIMGAFEVATMLPHVFQSWGDVEALQHGFEESLKKVTASLHDYSNLENRKRVRVRTLDPLSEEAQVIPIILKKICKPCVIPKYTIPYHLKDDLKDNQMGDDDQAIPQDTQADIQDDVEMGQEEENKEEMEVDEEPTENMTDAQKVLLEHLSRLEDAMATTPFCIECSSSGHVTTECPQGTSSDQMKVTDVIVNWRKRIMQEDDPSQEPRAKRKKSSKPSSSRSKVNDEFLKEEMLKAKVMVWYVDDSQPMDVAADRVEGGARKYNARTLADTGPSNLRHLFDIVERAFRFTKTLEPKSSASFYPLPTRPESKGHKPIDPKTKFGTVELVPINGVTFAHVEYDYGDLTYRTATDWVDDYSKEDKYLSKQLGNKLRHYIGRTVNYWGSRFDPIHCDEGGWVSWEDLVADDAVWQDEDSYRHRWQSQGNQISYKTRLAKFLEQNYRCYKKTKRVRFQMLAVKISLDEMQVPYNQSLYDWMKREGIREDLLRANDGWCYPVAVRATSGHSTDGQGRCDVELNLDKIGSKLSNQLTMELATSYHITTLDSIPSIIRYGIVPGGFGSSGRITTHFAVFPPWAYDEGYKGKPWHGRYVKLHQRPVVLYIPPHALQQYGLSINAMGTLLTERPIPFSEVRGAWLQCDTSTDARHPKIEWIRLLSRESNVESVVVLESKYGDIRRQPTWRKLQQLAVEVQDSRMSDDDQDLINMLDEIERQAISPAWGDREWSAVFDEVVFLRAWREYENRLCPNCLMEVDVRLTVCPGCVGVMIANGKIERIVPRAKRQERTPSPQRGDDTNPQSAQPDSDIKKVVEEARGEGEARDG